MVLAVVVGGVEVEAKQRRLLARAASKQPLDFDCELNTIGFELYW